MPGMIAIGDRLINGKTPEVAGIPGKSWAGWTAEAAGIPMLSTKGGLRSSQIVARYLPEVTGRYEYGVFGMGTNDTLTGIDPEVFRANVKTTAARMSEVSDQEYLLKRPFADERG